MNVVLLVLLVLVTFSIASAVLLALISIPTIVCGYRQRSEDEFHLAELRTAQVKAARHRDVR